MTKRLTKKQIADQKRIDIENALGRINHETRYMSKLLGSLREAMFLMELPHATERVDIVDMALSRIMADADFILGRTK